MSGGGPGDAWLVDASVALKWFLPADREPGADLARAAVGRLALRTTDLAVYEVGNVLTIHSGWDAAGVDRALALLVEICGEPLTLTGADRGRAAPLALDHRLTFYDASYAAVAERLGRRLLSANADLLRLGLATSLDAAVGYIP